ncbi:unnamed protein product [Caretta caretta]
MSCESSEEISRKLSWSWKCGLEGLSIYTSGAAQPDEEEEKERRQDDLFHEILQASGASDAKHGACRVTQW